MLGQDVIEAYLAGSKTSGQVNSNGITAVEAVCYDLSTHTSKSLDVFPESDFTTVFEIGRADLSPHLSAEIEADRQRSDSRELPRDEIYQIRDAIEEKVKHLLARI